MNPIQSATAFSKWVYAYVQTPRLAVFLQMLCGIYPLLEPVVYSRIVHRATLNTEDRFSSLSGTSAA
jgi:hypothetical protein